MFRKFVVLLLKNLYKVNKTLDEQFYILLILKKLYFYYKKIEKHITTYSRGLIFLDKKNNFIIAMIINRKAFAPFSVYVILSISSTHSLNESMCTMCARY